MLLSDNEVLKLKYYLAYKDIARKEEIKKSKNKLQRRLEYKFTFE